MSDEDKSRDESKMFKNIDVILKDIKNNGSTTKPLSIKTRGNNINLHPLII